MLLQVVNLIKNLFQNVFQTFFGINDTHYHPEKKMYVGQRKGKQKWPGSYH